MKVQFSKRNNIILLAILVGLLVISLSLLPFSEIRSENKDFVKIGVIDSGCAENQDSFVLEYKTFTTKDNGYPYDDMVVYDSLNHGSFVCQLINEQAPDARLFSAKIADSFGVLTYQGILAAISWLVEEKQVDIINLSLGSDSFISDLLDDVFRKYQNSTLFIAAVGNQGATKYDDRGYIEWPSTYPWVLGIGAFDPGNQLEKADYSSHGISYFGVNGVDFSDDGTIQNTFGTSFSTPKFTGKAANLLQQLRKLDVDTEIGEFVAILSYFSSLWNNMGFSFDIGWGALKVDAIQSLTIDKLPKHILALFGENEVDNLPRLPNEMWKRSWKFAAFGIDNTQDSIKITGNGSALITSVKYTQYNWSGFVEIEFNATEIGYYEINIASQFGNQIRYGFNIGGNLSGRILFDHRTSINGYGHSYGEFNKFELFIRVKGYSVNHILFDDPINLTEYDVVFVNRYNQLESVEGFELSRTITETIQESYVNYVKNGGSLIILTGSPFSSDISTDNSFLSEFDASFTGTEIGRIENQDRTCCPEFISNFTKDTITDNVKNFKYLGGEIHSTSNNSIEIGWILEIINKPLVTIRHYRSIGVYGNMGLGNYMILGSTDLITNPIFRSNDSGVGQLFLNFFKLIN